MSKQTLKITRVAVNLLKSCIERQGWATTSILVTAGGNVGMRIEDNFTDAPPVHDGKEEVKAFNDRFTRWANGLVEFEVSLSEIKAVKACMDKVISEGLLPPGRHALSILDALSMVEGKE